MHKSARFDAIMEALKKSGSQSVTDLSPPPLRGQLLGFRTRQYAGTSRAWRQRALALRESVHRRSRPCQTGPYREARFQPSSFSQERDGKRKPSRGLARPAWCPTSIRLMIDSWRRPTAYGSRGALRNHRDLFVLTNQLTGKLPRTLVRGPGNRVHVAGGEMRRDDNAVFGVKRLFTFFSAQFPLYVGCCDSFVDSGRFLSNFPIRRLLNL